jgi:hypothetical protein
VNFFALLFVTVDLCLEGLKQLLPADTAMALLSAYYTSSHHLPYSGLLDHFYEWLLTCLNLNGSKMEEGEREGKTGNLVPGQSSLQCVQDMMDSKMLNTVPALKLFTSAPMKQHCEMGVASTQAPPTSSLHTASLEGHREAVVYSLHLVYEVCHFQLRE